METIIKEEIWENLWYNESFWSIGFTTENLNKIKEHVFDEETIWIKISLLIPDFIEFKDLELFDYYTFSVIYTLLCETILEKLKLKGLLVFN